MSHPDMIQGIIETTSIPVMAKARIGHDGEARVLESLGVDMIDESEVLTLQIPSSTSRNPPMTSHSSVVRPTLVRPFGASPRAPP